MTMPDGQIGFVGKDVAVVLGYSRTADAIRQHVDDEDKGVFKMQTPGGVQSIVLINGEAWLMATDVARRLGYTNPQKAIRDHVEDEDKTLNESFTVNGTMAQRPKVMTRKPSSARRKWYSW